MGAENLFYAMNPELRGKEGVPANYNVKYPVLPKFKTFRKTFNKRYKKDKNRPGPYIYAFKGGDKESEALSVTSVNSGIFTNEADLLLAGAASEHNRGLFFGKTKKFVFVFFKLTNNQVQFELYKYRVVYYAQDQKGNTGEYNKSGDATYGYALLSAHIYDVEVYNQSNGSPVRISDDTVDPNEIIQRFDLYKKWNKILIQVYD